MNKRLLTLLLLMLSNLIYSIDNRFIQKWQKMQEYYLRLSEILKTNGYSEAEKTFCHPHWLKTKEHIKRVILGPPNEQFLKTAHISGTMLRQGINRQQIYEIYYLLFCISPSTKNLINSFKEGYCFDILKECKEFNCTVNTLGQLYYAVKIFEQGIPIQTIIEFGGGYGCLAYIFKQYLPQTTIVLVDLPELLAIQYLYLQLSLPETDIYLHTTAATHMIEQKINLIPVYYLKELNIKPDAFISNFALSETPAYVQNLVIEKNFFNAQLCYLTGQLNGWNGKFESHNILHSEIPKQYTMIEFHPFHIMLEKENLYSYELIGKRKI
ncbi:putative sugar O-methyltransferase [Candidatus Dependentiae bacterium]|nr:MAG: putative sugar O-methyltransferase [Candidatus Dependentiae bacterium]